MCVRDASGSSELSTIALMPNCSRKSLTRYDRSTSPTKTILEIQSQRCLKCSSRRRFLPLSMDQIEFHHGEKQEKLIVLRHLQNVLLDLL